MSVRRRPSLRPKWAAIASAGLLAATGVVPLGASAAADASVPGLGHVGSFHVPDNLVAAGDPPITPTSAEIVDITPDGDLLVYTDALTGRLGFVDISDPSAPAASGNLDLPGGPTSVAIHGGFALVAVVTS